MTTDSTEPLYDSKGSIVGWLDPTDCYILVSSGVAHHDDAGQLQLFGRVTKKELEQTLGGARVLQSARDVHNAPTVRRIRVQGGGEYFEHVLPRYAEQNADLFAGPMDRVRDRVVFILTPDQVPCGDLLEQVEPPQKNAVVIDHSWLRDSARWLVPFHGETFWVRPIEQLSAFLHTHGAQNPAMPLPRGNDITSTRRSWKRVMEEFDSDFERLVRSQPAMPGVDPDYFINRIDSGMGRCGGGYDARSEDGDLDKWRENLVAHGRRKYDTGPSQISHRAEELHTEPYAGSLRPGTHTQVHAKLPKRGRSSVIHGRTRMYALPERFWTDLHGRRIPNLPDIVFELKQRFGIDAETVRDLLLHDYSDSQIVRSKYVTYTPQDKQRVKNSLDRTRHLMPQIREHFESLAVRKLQPFTARPAPSFRCESTPVDTVTAAYQPHVHPSPIVVKPGPAGWHRASWFREDPLIESRLRWAKFEVVHRRFIPKWVRSYSYVLNTLRRSASIAA